jgi:hypothetical protein
MDRLQKRNNKRIKNVQNHKRVKSVEGLKSVEMLKKKEQWDLREYKHLNPLTFKQKLKSTSI